MKAADHLISRVFWIRKIRQVELACVHIAKNVLREDLPQSDVVTDYDRKAERKLQRFLRGDFKNGIGFENIEEPIEEIEQVAAGVPARSGAAQEP